LKTFYSPKNYFSSTVRILDFFELTPSSIGFPVSDPLIAGEIVEITLDFLATGVMALNNQITVKRSSGGNPISETLVYIALSFLPPRRG
jgi:hypothetical protein